ncbi:MAG: hypothetical protein IPP15_08680 [Saprospiraceae bacterium]|uniref:Uncharacterized protein n=1 Tax=Candidatus Opimibacter skivensis TaxID=2982028 RepID=A0A9D7SSG2_9BACT|nr:hypothetical protein [Candidatus Opimibacter skivensis]
MKTQNVADNDAKYETYYKMLTFIETMEGKQPTHPVFLPRGLYAPSNILEYVEGTMNLQYTDPRLTWDSYDNRTDTFTIALSSGYATLGDVQALVEKVRDTASVHFYSITEQDKFPVLYDAVNVSATSSIMYVSVLSMVGKVHRDPTPFGSTDYWDVFGGKCSPQSGGGTRKASDLINSALVEYFEPYGCTFFTNETEVYDLHSYGWGQLNPHDPTPGDFNIDFRTWAFYCADEIDPEDECLPEGIQLCSGFDEEDIKCLDPDEMNYYFGSIVDIYNSYTAETDLHHINSLNYLEFGLCDFLSEFWAAHVFFGTPNACESEIYPIPLPPCC